MAVAARYAIDGFNWRRLAIACCVAVLLAGCARPDAPATATSATDMTAPPPAAKAAIDTTTPTRSPPSTPTRETSDVSQQTSNPPASLPEPGPAPINTAQAAATAVETYFALLEAGRDADADALWGDPAQAKRFRSEFAALGDYHAEVGAPGGVEAAAGSMYVTVPVRFLPAASVPNPRPRMGEVVVRRVNDVPGSTEAQRRWHVERIDVAMTPK